MPYSFRVFPLLMLASSLAFAQAPAPTPSASAAPPADTPRPSELTARLLYQLLISELRFQDGATNQGVEVMLDAARRTANPELYKRAVEMAIQSRSGTMALDAVRAWRQAEPQSADANRMELQVLVALGRYAETDAPINATLSAMPAAEQEPFILSVPLLYTRATNKLEAAQVVERGLSSAVQNKTLAPAAWTTIGRMRLAASDRSGALSAATLGQASSTSSEWPALLALQIMTSANEANAESLVKRYLREETSKPEVQIGYARALLNAGRSQEAHTQLGDLTRRRPEYPEGWLALGLLLAQERQDEQAETALNHYLKISSETPADGRSDRDSGLSQARLTLAQIAERAGDYATAEKLLSSIDSPEEALRVQFRRASILARQGRIEDARQLVRSAPVRRPEDERMKLITEAQLLRDHQQPQQAYELLSGALKKDPEDHDLLYDTAMAAEKLNRVDEMERLLRKLIELKPDSQAAYNALGYTFADRGIRLPEAKQLIEKAVELAPDDPFIQDSLGWVEFRLGNQARALEILKAAYAKQPDAEIAAHLGEVLWVQGHRDAAKEIWREGVRLDPDNESLKKVIERLRVKL
ncbi:tetratricopeptide repeat protein [Ottowia caeni]|uniref:tetratricopeptide repeat protein n=1 Tax=Ottowia caeni TaxID=2870339 RepID=UPI001E37AE9B